jgi:hypothetical protein
MGFTALREIGSALNISYDPDPDPNGDIGLTFAEFVAAVGQLQTVGFPMERTAAEAWPHFRGWRVNYEGWLTNWPGVPTRYRPPGPGRADGPQPQSRYDGLPIGRRMKPAPRLRTQTTDHHRLSLRRRRSRRASDLVDLSKPLSVSRRTWPLRTKRCWVRAQRPAWFRTASAERITYRHPELLGQVTAEVIFTDRMRQRSGLASRCPPRTRLVLGSLTNSASSCPMALSDQLRDYRILSGGASLTLRPSRRFTMVIVADRGFGNRD